jgi:hypothetical protein
MSERSAAARSAVSEAKEDEEAAADPRPSIAAESARSADRHSASGCRLPPAATRETTTQEQPLNTRNGPTGVNCRLTRRFAFLPRLRGDRAIMPGALSAAEGCKKSVAKTHNLHNISAALRRATQHLV